MIHTILVFFGILLLFLFVKAGEFDWSSIGLGLIALGAVLVYTIL